MKISLQKSIHSRIRHGLNRKWRVKLTIGLLITIVAFEIAILLNPNLFSAALTNRPELMAEQAEKIKQECKNERSLERCYARVFGEFTKKNNINDSISVLRELQKIEPASRGCHLIAHSISIAETEKNPSLWHDLIGNMDVNFCSGGFMHGVLEAKQRIDSKFELNSKTINEICFYLKEKNGSFEELNCAHIMGHLILSQEAGSIPRGVKICDSIDNILRYECYSGVFMENETRENLILHVGLPRIPWNDKTIRDQEEICLQYKGEATAACWREIVHMYAARSLNHPLKVFSDCNKAPEQRSRDDCYSHGIGVMVASSNAREETFSLICAPFVTNGNKVKDCLRWAINSLMTSSDAYIDRVIKICSNISKNYESDCYKTLGEVLKPRNNKNILVKACSAIPSEFQDECLNAENLELPQINLDIDSF